MKRVSVLVFVGRRWTYLVAVLVVTVVGFSVVRLSGIFGSDDVVSRPPADSSDVSNYSPKTVLFEVFGPPGTTATINYLDVHAQPQRVDDASLPWSQSLTTNDPTVFADLRALGSGDFVGCRITVNGVVTEERSTHNVNGYISCLEKSA